MTTPLDGFSRPKVSRFIGLTRSGEEQLGHALTLLADRHDRDADVRDMLTKFAKWTRARHERMGHHVAEYGEVKSEHPERLRTALYYGTRAGGVGLVQDLQDLLVQQDQVETFYETLKQVAEELKDQDLLTTVKEHITELKRQMSWSMTRLRQAAPQAIVVPTDPKSELAASIPKRPSAVATPDPLWGPLAGALMVAVVGALSLVLGKPMVLPSLGPTAYLVAESPAHPNSRFVNVVAGHALGLIVGVIAVIVAGAAGEPSPLLTGVVTVPRVVATVLGLALLLIALVPLRVSHPPAAATTLLVTLGAVHSLEQMTWLIVGAVAIAIVGELLRAVRLRRLPPGPVPSRAERSRTTRARTT